MPALVEAAAVQSTYSKKVILAAGYAETGVEIRARLGAPGLHEMIAAAKSLDTPLENLTAFRTGPDHWEHFLLPGKTLGGGYVDHPMLP